MPMCQGKWHAEMGRSASVCGGPAKQQVLQIWRTFSRSLYRSLMVNSSCLDRLKWLSTLLVRMLDSFDMIISLSTCQSI